MQEWDSVMGCQAFRLSGAAAGRDSNNFRVWSVQGERVGGDGEARVTITCSETPLPLGLSPLD